jgi:hypothetical protein
MDGRLTAGAQSPVNIPLANCQPLFLLDYNNPESSFALNRCTSYLAYLGHSVLKPSRAGSQNNTANMVWGLNQDLQSRLEAEFKPKGIVAYSNCCRWGCTGSYDEDDDEFVGRQQGIYYIRLHLNGMNYNPRPLAAYVQYSDHAYLIEHWDEESGFLKKWAEILGVKSVTITKPADERQAVEVSFAVPLELEEEVGGDDDEENLDGEAT